MEEEKLSIEKPKKQKQPISDKQREQLRVMREKKKAYKIAGVRPPGSRQSVGLGGDYVAGVSGTLVPNQLKSTQLTQPETRKEYQPVSELVKLSDDIAFIKNHILEKKKLKEQKEKVVNSVDIQSHNDENDKLVELQRLNYIKSNFIR